MSGTDLAHAAIRGEISGTDLAYAATRLLIPLIGNMVVFPPLLSYALSGTENRVCCYQVPMRRVLTRTLGESLDVYHQVQQPTRRALRDP
eukprot:3940997-Rhodomonas_salina.1